MQVFIHLFLRRFRKPRRYSISMGSWVVFQVLLWFLRNFIEEIIFNALAQHINISGDRMLLISVLGILAILIWMYIDTRKEFSSQHLQNTLKEMHKQILHLKDAQLRHDQPSRQQLEEMIPVLMYKLGIVDIGGWDKFIKKTAKQMKGAITQRGIRQGTWHYQLASVTSRMQRDLLASKESTISNSDIDILAEWFGSQSWAIENPYRTDKRWTILYNSIEPFTRDNKLQGLINDHILVTYVSSNALLVDAYIKNGPIAYLYEYFIRLCKTIIYHRSR